MHDGGMLGLVVVVVVWLGLLVDLELLPSPRFKVVVIFCNIV